MAESKVSMLENLVASLSARLQALEGTTEKSSSVSVEKSLTSTGGGTSGFKPVAASACLQMVPCLRSSARERLAAGCPDALWHGKWALDPTELDAKTNASRWRDYLRRGVGALELQHFHTAAEDQCEPANAFLLSSKRPGWVPKLTDANELHAKQRLRGLRDTLWLMIGTSVDHMVVRDLCADYNAARRAVEANATSLHPQPGLHMDYCRLPAPLSMTIAYVGYHGLTTMEVNVTDGVQQRRFGEIHALLERIGHGKRGPDFLSLSGIEWDFKQWGLQNMQPTSPADWERVRRSILLQVDGAKSVWPQMRGTFLRTMYRTTYRWSKAWVDVNGSEYHRYNNVMRDLATGHSMHWQQQLPSAAPAVYHQHASRMHARRCGGIHLLDMASVMNCSNEVDYLGACSPYLGWTIDGLHPSQWVLRAFFLLALNTLADYGEVCDARATAEDEAP